MYQKLLDFLEHRSGDIIATILIFIIGYVLARILLSISQKAIAKSKLDPICHKFFLSLLKVTLYSVVVILGCSRFVDTSSLVALLSVVGVAVSLAVKDSLSNIANGIMLVTMKPFNVGDFVEVNGTTGTVVAIHMISTVLQTTDNKYITIPNNEVLSNNIINYNAMTTRRLDLVVSCSYDSDIKLVKKTLLDLVEKDSRIFSDPAPVCELDVMNSSSLDFTLRVWLKSSDYYAVRWSLNEQIINKFNELNIEIPYNQLDVRVRK